MYTAKPPVPTPHSGTNPQQATPCRPWWTIPKADRFQMHAFTRPSHHIRLKIRDALAWGLHQASLYMRLVLIDKERGAHTTEVSKVMHIRLLSNHWEGTSLLKFIFDLSHLYPPRKKKTPPPGARTLYLTGSRHSLLRRTSTAEGSRMSPKTPSAAYGVSPPTTRTHSAQRPQAVCHDGSFR
jgi:hypothetical protein